MSKIKLFYLVLVLFFGFLITTNNSPVNAQEKPVNIWFFYSETCPHCQDEMVFLKKVTDENPDVKVNYFEVIKNKQNSKFLSWLNKELDLNVTGVPFTLIGNKTFRGFTSEESTGPGMISAIECTRQGSCPDIVSLLVAGQEVQEVPVSEQPNEMTDSSDSGVFLILALAVLGAIVFLVLLFSFVNKR